MIHKYNTCKSRCVKTVLWSWLNLLSVVVEQYLCFLPAFFLLHDYIISWIFFASSLCLVLPMQALSHVLISCVFGLVLSVYVCLVFFFSCLLLWEQWFLGQPWVWSSSIKKECNAFDYSKLNLLILCFL